MVKVTLKQQKRQPRLLQKNKHKYQLVKCPAGRGIFVYPIVGLVCAFAA